MTIVAVIAGGVAAMTAAASDHGSAPGASFCLDQSKSPGAHPGP